MIREKYRVSLAKFTHEGVWSILGHWIANGRLGLEGGKGKEEARGRNSARAAVRHGRRAKTRRSWPRQGYGARFSNSTAQGGRGGQGELDSNPCASEEGLAHHGPRRRHCRPAGARGYSAITHQNAKGEVRERAGALASSPGRKKGTGTDQIRGDAVQRFTTASTISLSAPGVETEARRGGKWGGEGARARGLSTTC